MADSAVLWLVNDQQEILLCKQPPSKRKLFAPLPGPGKWGASIVSDVKHDEPPAHALLVQAQAILHVNPQRHDPQELVSIGAPRADGSVRTVHFMYSMVPANIRLIPDKRHAVDTRWLGLDELLFLLEVSPKKLVPEAGTVWPKPLRRLRELGLV
jgi:hypothetical protein